jgi:DNA-binding transcriptional LysR family regulator
MCVEAVREGLGLGLAPRLIGDRDPALARLETRSPPTPREVWLAYHEDIEPSPRVRAVIDFLVDALSD